MTLRELITITFKEENILDREIAYFVKDNPDGTFDAISINSLGLSDDYILLANKCPQCEN